MTQAAAPPSPRRHAGRPRLGPAERVTLTMRPEDKAELLALANGRQITAYVLDCVRYTAQHRPASRVERPLRTVYTAQVLEVGPGGPDHASLAQVVTDTYRDGRQSARYTGIEYSDAQTARADCVALTRLFARGRGARVPLAPGGALTPQDGG